MNHITSPAMRTMTAIISQQMPPQAVPDETWAEITRLALSNSMGPMLLWTIRQAWFDLDPELLNTLRQVAHNTAIRYVYLDLAQKQVNAALVQATIPAIWLKGVALARTVYPQPSLRSMCDLDVIVPQDQLETALSVIQALGYNLYQPEKNGTVLDFSDPLEKMKLDLSHHHVLVGGLKKSVIVELHWRFFNELPAQHLAWFLEQKYPLDSTGESYTLTPTAHLLYLCAHAVLQHGEMDINLRPYLDMHLLITRTEPDWVLLVNQAIELQWAFGAEWSLSRVVELFATPIPDWVLPQLREQRSHDENVAQAIGLQVKGRQSVHIWRKLGQLSWRDKIRFVTRIVVPSRVYIRRRYPAQSHQPLWQLYVHRWRDQGQNVIWAIRNRLNRHRD